MVLSSSRNSNSNLIGTDVPIKTATWLACCGSCSITSVSFITRDPPSPQKHPSMRRILLRTHLARHQVLQKSLVTVYDWLNALRCIRLNNKPRPRRNLLSHPDE